MTADARDLKEELQLWMASEHKVAIAVFFRNNPGVVDTLDNLSERLAIGRETLRRELADHVRLGIVRERRIGADTVYMLDRRRRSEIEGYVTKLVEAA